MRIAARLVATAVAVLIGSAAVSAAELQVGLAAVDITPDYPVRLSGFGFRRTESEGVTQRIWAKAIAFGDKDPSVIVTVDSLGVPEHMRKDVAGRLAKEAALDPARFAITSSHSHTTPMVSGVLRTLFGRPVLPEEQTRIDRYTRELADNIEKAALVALADRKPARLEFGVGAGDLAMNRRTKGGPVDHDLPVLAVRAPDGTLRGVYVSYACHCVTLSNNKISGDWAGFLQEHLQKDNPGAIALTSIGCGADANPTSGVTGDKTDVANEQGRKLAAEVGRMLKAGALAPVSGAVETKAAEIELMFDTLPTREQYQKTADANQEYVSYHAKAQLERLDRGEALQTKLPYLIQTWTFGNDLAMVFLPGEVVADYSLRIKREFDRSRLWVNAYANDVPCYIPSERVLKEGGYEGAGAMTFYDRPTRLATGVEQRIIDEVHRQLPMTFLAPAGTEGIAPKSAADSLKTIRTKPGLEVELVAAEPLVTSPVAIDWSADGRLWVCEMFDYPTGVDQNWQPGGRVKVLEDIDRDGRYDKATVFLEHLPFPTGVTAFGRGVFVCAAPDILYAEDTDGDGKADKVEKLFTGFVTENYQARVNSLSIGLDNWIYGANGLLGGTITDGWKTKGVDIRNHDFRFRPLRGSFETVTGLTQQGRARDDWGRWFGCDNGSGMLYYPHEERYLARNPHVPTPPPVVRPPGVDYNPGRVYPISRQLERFNNPGAVNQFTAGCGLGVYRDTLLGDEFYGNVFTCEPVNNLVHRMIPVVDDAGIVTGRRRAKDEAKSEFLASADNWFRPVQARPGPDGALYVVDMYRFLIEHPRWIPAERLAKIDARAGADRGRIYRVRPKGQPLRAVADLSKRSPADLAAALDNPNGIERDRVHIELLHRKDVDVAPALTTVAREARLPQVRAQALCILEGLGPLNPATLLHGLNDGDAKVRKQAVRLCESLPDDVADGDIVERLHVLADDPSPMVRHQLAYSIGQWNDNGATLVRLVKSGLADDEMRAAVLSSAAGRHCGAVLAALMETPEDSPGRDAWLPPIVATAAASGDAALFAQALAVVLPHETGKPAPAHFESLASLLDALERRNATLPADLAPRLARTLTAARVAAADDKAAPAARVSALKVLGRGDAPADELDLLCRLAGGNDDPAVRDAAISSLRRQKSAGVPERLMKAWRQTSPSARPALINLLLGRDEWTIALLDAVKRNVVGRSEVSLADRQRLAAEGVRDDIRKLAAEVFPAATATDATRQAVIDRYASVGQMTGDAAKGATVFAEQCAACHLLNGAGHPIGPDLAILRERDADYFVKNILDPSAVVEPRFTNYQIVLKNRRTLAGLISSETAAGLTLQTGGGGASASETISRADVKDIRASKISMMPDGFEAAIAPERMADLIAFLKSSGSRKTFPDNEPATVEPARNGSLVLTAAVAEIYGGGDIAFESEFRNVGMWHGLSDYVAWNVRVDKPGDYDVHFDFACADVSAGNPFVLSAGDATVNGVVPATGAGWDVYKQARVGAIRLSAGQHRVVVRPGATLRNALIDLRTVVLTPPGVRPRWPRVANAVVNAGGDNLPRDPASIAKVILDPTVPNGAREAAINANPQFAAELIVEMTRDLPPNAPEKLEYERIPWIWRVAVASGKRNDAAELKSVLDVSLPKPGEPLRDWQAVVIGGGIVNGISLRGPWPAVRVAEIIGDDKAMKGRWQRSLDLAVAMADDEKVRNGTRYDALRMLGVEPWEKRGEHLVRYLAKGTNAELQQGAVSGVADVDSPHATATLLKALPGLTPQNGEFALDALLRDDARATALLQALADGKVARETLGKARAERLLKHESPDVRRRAEDVLKDK